LFTEDCLVHGSSLAGAVHQGRDAVKQHILELQNAFPDLVFYVEDLVADGVNVFIRWLARGTHKGQLWDYPGTGEERLLRGSMMCKVKEGNQRITDMYFYWSISSVYSLL
jgi:predicted ester cyclase